MHIYSFCLLTGSFLVDYLEHVGLTQEFRNEIEEVDSFYRSHLGIEAIVKETIHYKYYSLNDEELVIVLPGNNIFFIFQPVRLVTS